MASKNQKLMKVAQQIVAEFDSFEASRGSAFRVVFKDPLSGHVIENAVAVRVRLLRELRNAVKAEAAHAA